MPALRSRTSSPRNAIASGCVERLRLVHGELHIRSEPGEGAVVTAFVPLGTQTRSSKYVNQRVASITDRNTQIRRDLRLRGMIG